MILEDLRGGPAPQFVYHGVLLYMDSKDPSIAHVHRRIFRLFIRKGRIENEQCGKGVGDYSLFGSVHPTCTASMEIEPPSTPWIGKRMCSPCCLAPTT